MRKVGQTGVCAGCRPQWVQPEVVEGWGLAGEVTAAALEHAFEAAAAAGSPAAAAVLVSPTYFGQVSDIAGAPGEGSNNR